MNLLDLHCHSTASDGDLPPAELVARAAARGCRILALTDHDCTAGLAEAGQAAETCGVQLVAGVEVSVTWRNRTIHVVGLGIDPQQPDLALGLKSIREGRIGRAEAMAADLLRVGVEDAFAGAMRYCSNPEMISRTHFARYLIETGRAKDKDQAFKRFLVNGKPGYVRHQWAELADAVRWIRAAGGIAVIAHPGRYKIGRRLMGELIADFKAAGGEAIEVVSASHSASEISQFGKLARAEGLLASSGSDFHAPGEGGRDVGLTQPLPEGCLPVWERLGLSPADYAETL